MKKKGKKRNNMNIIAPKDGSGFFPVFVHIQFTKKTVIKKKIKNYVGKLKTSLKNLNGKQFSPPRTHISIEQQKNTLHHTHSSFHL